MSPNTKGALLMVASMVSFTVNDAFLKATDGALPLAQLLTIRGACASVLIIVLGLWLRGLRLDLGGRAWRMIMMRSVTEIGAAYCFLTALLNLPLANVSAILQALPLTVTLGAYLLFGEPVGWRRLVAILLALSRHRHSATGTGRVFRLVSLCDCGGLLRDRARPCHPAHA